MQRFKLGSFSLLSSRAATIITFLYYFTQAAYAENNDTSSGMTWVSPSSADVYASGDKMTLTWTAPYKTTSPSFRLCSGESHECGKAVWPDVKRMANGTYSIRMKVPGLDEDSSFFVRMQDDDGETSDTPMFALRASVNQSKQSIISGPPPESSRSSSGSYGSSSQSDHGTSSGGSSDQGKAKGSKETEGHLDADGRDGARTSGTPAPNISVANNTALPVTVTSVSASLLPSTTDSRLVTAAEDSKPSAAAIAVPLALFGAALAGLVFSLRQRSMAKKEAKIRGNTSLDRAVDKDSSDAAGERSQKFNLERALEFISGVQQPKLAPLPPSTESKRLERMRERQEYDSDSQIALTAQEDVLLTQVPRARTRHEDQVIERLHSASLVAHSACPVYVPKPSRGPTAYRLPSTPQLASPVGPLTHSALLGSSLGSSQAIVGAAPGLEPASIRTSRPPSIIRLQPLELSQSRPAESIAHQRSQTQVGSGVQMAQCDPALWQVQMPVPSSSLVVPVPPPPVLPASLQAARPPVHLPPECPPCLKSAQFQPPESVVPAATLGPSIPFSTRPSTSSLSSTLSNPYAAIEVALRAGGQQ